MSDLEKQMKEQERKLVDGKAAIRKAIADTGIESVHLLPQIMGEIAHENFSSRTDGFLNNGINWMMAQYAAHEVKALTPQILKLCDWLIKNEHDKKNPFDEYYDEEYTAIMVNAPECIVLLSATEYFTYVIKIDIKNSKRFVEKEGGFDTLDLTTHEVHMRYLVDAKMQPAKMKSIKSWDWLSDLDKVNSNTHFRYKDTRDDGYLLSVKQDKYDGEDWSCKNALENYPMLCRVNRHLFQLFAETDCLDD